MTYLAATLLKHLETTSVDILRAFSSNTSHHQPTYRNEVDGSDVVMQVSNETQGKTGMMSKFKEKVRKVKNVLKKPMFGHHGHAPESNPAQQQVEEKGVPVEEKGIVTSLAHGSGIAHEEKGKHDCQVVDNS